MFMFFKTRNCIYHASVCQLLYYSIIVHTLRLYIHGHGTDTGMSVHVYARWSGFQMNVRTSSWFVRVHTHTTPTHTSFRHHHPCGCHQSPSDACPALLWQIGGIASCTHHTPEQLRLPFHTAKCSQSTVHYMLMKNMVELCRSPARARLIASSMVAASGLSKNLSSSGQVSTLSLS